LDAVDEPEDAAVLALVRVLAGPALRELRAGDLPAAALDDLVVERGEAAEAPPPPLSAWKRTTTRTMIPTTPPPPRATGVLPMRRPPPPAPRRSWTCEGSSFAPRRNRIRGYVDVRAPVTAAP
jgi:hypothetical protein